MSGYRFGCTCPDCDGVLVHRDDTAEVASPTRSSVECWCETCLIVWRIEAVMVPIMAVPLQGRAAQARDRARERAGDGCVSDDRKVFA